MKVKQTNRTSLTLEEKNTIEWHRHKMRKAYGNGGMTPEWFRLDKELDAWLEANGIAKWIRNV